MADNEKPLRFLGISGRIEAAGGKIGIYDRWACPHHLGTMRRRCPICGVIYCPKCDPDHIEGCRDNADVGS